MSNEDFATNSNKPEDVSTETQVVEQKVPNTWYWVRDAQGFGSVSVTLVFISFWVTTLVYILSSFSSIGPVTFRPFDVGACAAYFAPILALYGSRKLTTAKYGK